MLGRPTELRRWHVLLRHVVLLLALRLFKVVRQQPIATLQLGASLPHDVVLPFLCHGVPPVQSAVPQRRGWQLDGGLHVCLGLLSLCVLATLAQRQDRRLEADTSQVPIADGTQPSCHRVTRNSGGLLRPHVDKGKQPWERVFLRRMV